MKFKVITISPYEYENCLRFESLYIDESLRQDVFKHFSLEIKIYIVLKDKACLCLDWLIDTSTNKQRN